MNPCFRRLARILVPGRGNPDGTLLINGESHSGDGQRQMEGSVNPGNRALTSEPPMPDASVLSYILLGQPPGTKGGSYTLGNTSRRICMSATE